MNPLQYKSDEMYSSTELIRKSKNIFQKLQKNKIEKAVILRDGKPSFMLLDFKQYEEIMTEYLSLKQTQKNESKKASLTEKPKEIEIEVEKKPAPIKKEIDDEELENALAEIENLNLEEIHEEEGEPLKDFWKDD